MVFLVFLGRRIRRGNRLGVLTKMSYKRIFLLKLRKFRKFLKVLNMLKVIKSLLWEEVMRLQI